MTPGNRQPLTPDARQVFLEMRVWNLRRLLQAVVKGDRPRRGTTNWRLLHAYRLLPYIGSKDLATRIYNMLVRHEDRLRAVTLLLDAENLFTGEEQNHVG